MWTTKPTIPNCQDVGLLWKGVSVLYEELPDGPDEAQEEVAQESSTIAEEAPGKEDATEASSSVEEPKILGVPLGAESSTSIEKAASDGDEQAVPSSIAVEDATNVGLRQEAHSSISGKGDEKSENSDEHQDKDTTKDSSEIPAVDEEVDRNVAEADDMRKEASRTALNILGKQEAKSSIIGKKDKNDEKLAKDQSADIAKDISEIPHDQKADSSIMEVEDLSTGGNTPAVPRTPDRLLQNDDLSSSLILTPPALGKVLELSFMDGKLVQRTTEREDSNADDSGLIWTDASESAPSEKNSKQKDDAVPENKTIEEPLTPVRDVKTLSPLKRSSVVQSPDPKLKASPRKQPVVRSVTPRKSPIARSPSVFDSSNTLTERTPPAKVLAKPAVTSAAPLSSPMDASPMQARADVQPSPSTSSATPSTSSATPSTSSATPSTSSATPSSALDTDKAIPGLKPIATIPLGRFDKPVRFVLPASSLKTLMQSGSANLYDHIKAITSALQKETTPGPDGDKQESNSPTEPIASTSSSNVQGHFQGPRLMPPIIGQMGRPAFRMNAPFGVPGPRLSGVRVRMPRSGLPPVPAPVSTSTSAGLKVRLPRLGSLKNPDLSLAIDDTPLSPPPVGDPNHPTSLKSPTGSLHKSIDAITAVIQQAARSMKSPTSVPTSLKSPTAASHEKQNENQSSTTPETTASSLSASTNQPEEVPKDLPKGQKAALRPAIEAKEAVKRDEGETRSSSLGSDHELANIEQHTSTSLSNPLQSLSQPSCRRSSRVSLKSATAALKSLPFPTAASDEKQKEKLSSATVTPTTAAASTDLSEEEPEQSAKRLRQKTALRRAMEATSPAAKSEADSAHDSSDSLDHENLEQLSQKFFESTRRCVAASQPATSQSLLTQPSVKRSSNVATPPSSLTTPQIQPVQSETTPSQKPAAVTELPSEQRRQEVPVISSMSTAQGPAQGTTQQRIKPENTETEASAVTVSPENTVTEASAVTVSPENTETEASPVASPVLKIPTQPQTVVAKEIPIPVSSGLKPPSHPPVTAVHSKADVVGQPSMSPDKVQWYTGANIQMSPVKITQVVRRSEPMFAQGRSIEPVTSASPGLRFSPAQKSATRNSARQTVPSQSRESVTPSNLPPTMSPFAHVRVLRHPQAIISGQGGHSTTGQVGPITEPSGFTEPKSEPGKESPTPQSLKRPARSPARKRKLSVKIESPVAKIPKEGVKQETREKLQSMLRGNLAEKLIAKQEVESPTPQILDRPTSAVMPRSSRRKSNTVTRVVKGDAVPGTPSRTVPGIPGGMVPGTILKTPVVMTTPQGRTTPEVLDLSLKDVTPRKPDPSPNTSSPANRPGSGAVRKFPPYVIANQSSNPRLTPQRPTTRSAPSTPAGTKTGKSPAAAQGPVTPQHVRTASVGGDDAVHDKIKQMLIAGGLAKANTPIKFNIPSDLNLSGLKFNVVSATDAAKMGLFSKPKASTSSSTTSDSMPIKDESVSAGASSNRPSGSGSADRATSSSKKLQESTPSEETALDQLKEEKLPQYDGATDEPPKSKRARIEHYRGPNMKTVKPSDTNTCQSDSNGEEVTEDTPSEPAVEDEGETSKCADEITLPGTSESGVSENIRTEEEASNGNEDQLTSSLRNVFREVEMPLRKRRKRGERTMELPSLSFQSLERVNIVPRPWVKPDGDVNEVALCNMMEAVLMYLMSKPGATFNSLTSKYKAVLQPIAILELLETLEKIGCIKTLWMKGSHECSLFSPRATYTLEPRGNIEDASFFPDINCPARMGHFKSQLSVQQDPSQPEHGTYSREVAK